METILIIDDHEATCKYIQHVCASHGIQCLAALTAEVGLSLARQHNPRLIFIDLHLTDGISGWEVIRRIKNDDRLKTSVVVTISAGDHMESAAEVGSDGYLLKPFTVYQVKNMIYKYLE
jgi:two-component system cell cycle response regulator DivK